MNVIRKFRKGIANPRSAMNYALRHLNYKIQYYYYDDYYQYYLKTTKSNVHENPEGSVGPAELFDEMREWQFEYLVGKGLEKEDTLLDLGCGILRGGLPLVAYLNNGNYYGMDISADALDVGREAIEERSLESKDPTLINNEDLEFNESELTDITFDYVWAQSVITHLPPENLEELLSNMDKVLSQTGEFHATIWETEDEIVVKANKRDFHYPLEHLSNIATKYGLSVERVEEDHPNDLQPIKFFWNDES